MWSVEMLDEGSFVVFYLFRIIRYNFIIIDDSIMCFDRSNVLFI